MNGQVIDWESVWLDADISGRDARKILWDQVLSPLKQWYGKNVGARRGQELLQTCFERAEQLFKETCKQRSIEFWLPMVRSLAGKTIQIPNHETFSTLGLLKYCDLSANDVVPVGPDGPAFGLALQYSSDDLVDAQRLAYLAFLMAAISNAYRRIGKGACFRPTEALPLNDPAPESVAIAMKSYDDRRPRDEFFRDQALMYNVPLEPDEIYFVGTARGHDGGRFVVPEWGESWPCVRVPAFIEADGAIEVLQEYRRAFEHTHKIPLKSVFHFLSSLAALIAVSIPRQEPGGELEIRLSAREGDDETGWRRVVDFLLGFSRKGYFRFPLEHWLDKVAKTRSPWASDDAESRQRAEQFFQAFCVDATKQGKIDLSMMRPMPFCFKTPNNWVYVDVQATGDFLSGLVESGRAWFSDRAGDLFTLTVKERVEAECPKVKVLDWKKKLPVKGKNPVETDLLLATESTLFVVECKAYSKSAKFYRGDRNEIRLRTLKLKEALAHRQAG